MTWDAEVLMALNRLAGTSPLVDAFMVGLGHAGNYLVPGILAFAYWFWARRRESLLGATALAALIVFTDFLGAQIKHLIGRSRPCHMLDTVQQLAGCGGTFSFPSNHAMNAAAAAAFGQILYPASGWLTWPVVVMTGISRIYVGAHFPTDVLGGWVLGAIVGGIAGWLLCQWSVFRPGGPGVVVREGGERPSID